MEGEGKISLAVEEAAGPSVNRDEVLKLLAKVSVAEARQGGRA